MYDIAVKLFPAFFVGTVGPFRFACCVAIFAIVALTVVFWPKLRAYDEKLLQELEPKPEFRGGFWFI